MESTTTTQAVADSTTVGPVLSDDKPKITGQEAEISLADLHNSAGESNNAYPGKAWKTKTDPSIKDQTTELPLGMNTNNFKWSLIRKHCLFSRFTFTLA